jgi:hypothetical protein
MYDDTLVDATQRRIAVTSHHKKGVLADGAAHSTNTVMGPTVIAPIMTPTMILPASVAFKARLGTKTITAVSRVKKSHATSEENDAKLCICTAALLALRGPCTGCIGFALVTHVEIVAMSQVNSVAFDVISNATQ